MQQRFRIKQYVAGAVFAALAGGVGAATPATQVRATASAEDQGVASPAALVSAVVLVANRNEAAFDASVRSLHDISSPSYHQWLSESAIAAGGPADQDVATVQASLAAQGLNVDKVLPGGLIHVSGTAAQFQAAFGASVHQYKTATGKTFLKAASTPSYKGANAQLVAGVSAINGNGVKPMLARQMDLATRTPVALAPAVAGTDPLAGFTSQCFDAAPTTAKMSGFGAIPGVGGGGVKTTAVGPTYLSTVSTSNRPACGYTAQQLVQHYGIDEAHGAGLTGRGQTIVIVDSYGSPTIAQDVNNFSAAMGLPAMDASKLQVVYPDGKPSTANGDWALETTLDVEWAHAFAPDAKIVLVVAPSDDNAELAYAVEYAARHRLGNVISNSWGMPESDGDPGTVEMFDTVFRRAAARGIAVNVATGDSGDNGMGTPVGAASIPADSRWSTGIGGTSIDVPSDNGPVESSWGLVVTTLGRKIQPFPIPDIKGFLQGSGGGESVFVPKPEFEAKLPGMGRQLPDISALADPQTGAIVTITNDAGQQLWGVIGGTSLATPIFSSIWALVDQAAGESLGQAAPILGKLPKFAIRDVLPIASKHVNTSASIIFRDSITTNYDPAQLLGLDKTQPTGFEGTLVLAGRVPYVGWAVVGFGADSSLRAAPGWDNATGYGVPAGMMFIDAAAFFSRYTQQWK